MEMDLKCKSQPIHTDTIWCRLPALRFLLVLMWTKTQNTFSCSPCFVANWLPLLGSFSWDVKPLVFTSSFEFVCFIWRVRRYLLRELKKKKRNGRKDSDFWQYCWSVISSKSHPSSSLLMIDLSFVGLCWRYFCNFPANCMKAEILHFHCGRNHRGE